MTRRKPRLQRVRGNAGCSAAEQGPVHSTAVSPSANPDPCKNQKRHLKRIFSLDIGRAVAVSVMSCVHCYGTWLDIPAVLSTGIFSVILAPIAFFAQFRGIFVIVSTAVMGYRQSIQYSRQSIEKRNASGADSTAGSRPRRTRNPKFKKMYRSITIKAITVTLVTLLAWPIFSCLDVIRDGGEEYRFFVSRTHRAGGIFADDSYFEILPRSSPIGFIALLYSVLNILFPCIWIISHRISETIERRRPPSIPRLMTEISPAAQEAAMVAKQQFGATSMDSIQPQFCSSEDDNSVPDAFVLPTRNPGEPNSESYDQAIRVFQAVQAREATLTFGRRLRLWARRPEVRTWIISSVILLAVMLLTALRYFVSHGYIVPGSDEYTAMQGWRTLGDIAFPAQLTIHHRPAGAPLPSGSSVPDHFDFSGFVRMLLTNQLSGDLMGLFPYIISGSAGLIIGGYISQIELDITLGEKNNGPILTMADRINTLFLTMAGVMVPMFTVFAVWWAFYHDAAAASHTFQGYFFLQKLFGPRFHSESNSWHSGPYECLLCALETLCVGLLVLLGEFTPAARRMDQQDNLNQFRLDPRRIGSRVGLRWLRRFSTYSATIFTFDCYIQSLFLVAGLKLGIPFDDETHYMKGAWGVLWVLLMPLPLYVMCLILDLCMYIPCPDFILSWLQHVFSFLIAEPLEAVTHRKLGHTAYQQWKSGRGHRLVSAFLPREWRNHCEVSVLRLFTQEDSLPRRGKSSFFSRLRRHRHVSESPEVQPAQEAAAVPESPRLSPDLKQSQ